jgi:ABC-2 type transport system ATP-binding protein
MSSTVPSLDIKGIYAGYGAAPVIEDITLSVDSGQTYGLIGLNGAGKTTLLKTVLGLKDQIGGEILIAGHIAGTKEAKKEIAYLPERFDPPWFLSAYEFIDFTLSLYGRKVQRSDVDEMANHLGLNVSYLSKRAQTYSKGMRQKLGLMAAFLTDCPLLILDEPMSGLDPLARAQVKDLMTRAKNKRQTVFLSSHILSDLEELCDCTAVLHAGKIQFIGKPAALLETTGEQTLERAFLSLINRGMKAAA